MEVAIGSKAPVRKELTVENVIDSSGELLEDWAARYFLESPQLAEELVEETKLHVLKLHQDGCLKGNPAYEFYLSTHQAEPHAEANLNAQLVLATMESVLYHHFINPNEETLRSYGYANLALNRNLRKEQIESGALQRASDIFYLVTGVTLSGTEPSYIADLDEKMHEAQIIYAPDMPSLTLSRKDIKRNANRAYPSSDQRKTKEAIETLAEIKKYARAKRIGSRWASRLAELSQLLGFGPKESIEMIDMYAADPRYRKQTRADYRQAVKSKI